MPIFIAGYLPLICAIILEVLGTSMLQKSAQFTRPIPTLMMATSYAGSFYCLSLALKAIPLGIAYAVWAGAGIVLIALIGVVVFRQTLDAPAMIGIGLIVAGVVIVNVFSKSISH